MREALSHSVCRHCVRLDYGNQYVNNRARWSEPYTRSVLCSQDSCLAMLSRQCLVPHVSRAVYANCKCCYTSAQRNVNGNWVVRAACSMYVACAPHDIVCSAQLAARSVQHAAYPVQRAARSVRHCYCVRPTVCGVKHAACKLHLRIGIPCAVAFIAFTG